MAAQPRAGVFRPGVPYIREGNEPGAGARRFETLAQSLCARMAARKIAVRALR
jgi:hypothetical protein